MNIEKKVLLVYFPGTYEHCKKKKKKKVLSVNFPGTYKYWKKAVYQFIS